LKAKITFYLPVRLKEKVKRLCKEYGVSMSAFIRSLILLYLNNPVKAGVVEEVTVLRKRRMLIPVDTERHKLWRDVQKEIKQVLAGRRIE